MSYWDDYGCDEYNDDGSPMEGIKPRPQTITKEN